MGANRQQGWAVFVFLIGFSLMMAGFAYLGPIFYLVGIALLVGSLIAFYQLKPLEGEVPGHQHAASVSGRPTGRQNP
jgi:hypothetical protein